MCLHLTLCNGTDFTIVMKQMSLTSTLENVMYNGHSRGIFPPSFPPQVMLFQKKDKKNRIDQNQNRIDQKYPEKCSLFPNN